jgi:hypothetical protein
MKTEWSLGITPSFLTLALDGGKLVSFMPLSPYSWGKSPGTHWIRGWMGPRTGLDTMEKRIILPLLGVEPQPYSLFESHLFNISYSNLSDIEFSEVVNIFLPFTMFPFHP